LIGSSPLAVAGLAAALAFALSPLARTLASRVGIVDRPDARKDHVGDISLLGGGAVLLAAALAALASGAVPRSWGAVAGTAFAFAVGLLDDARKGTFPAWGKLAGQIAAAALAVTGGVRLDLLPSAAADAFLSTLLLVAAMNAVNFLDNMDGLAAGLLAVGSGALALSGAAEPLAPAALAGACLGFLPWNYPRPRIFLGDAGSHGLGFALASLAIAAARERVSPTPIAIALALPLLDLVRVAATRLLTRRPLHRADRLHLSFVVADAGLSRRVAAPVLWALAAALAAASAYLYQRTTFAAS
jgi:UDP-GlcNAc:undecaprenyl-phosphate GlcNAc-1-phosphate transferase